MSLGEVRFEYAISFPFLFFFANLEYAISAFEKAGNLDLRSTKLSVLLNNIRAVARAHARGNDHVKSERYTNLAQCMGKVTGFIL